MGCTSVYHVKQVNVLAPEVPPAPSPVYTTHIRLHTRGYTHKHVLTSHVATVESGIHSWYYFTRREDTLSFMSHPVHSCWDKAGMMGLDHGNHRISKKTRS